MYIFMTKGYKPNILKRMEFKFLYRLVNYSKNKRFTRNLNEYDVYNVMAENTWGQFIISINNKRMGKGHMNAYPMVKWSDGSSLDYINVLKFQIDCLMEKQ